MEKQQQLTRTCIACGLDKPLAAFLQITGAQGTVYGNICSSCRGMSAKEKLSGQKNEADERSGSASGLKIDSKRKVQTEQEKRQQIKKTKEINLEEAVKDELLEKDKLERKDTKAKEEKDHRKNYIEEKQKQRFLSYRDKKQPLNKQIPLAKIQQEKRFLTERYQTIEAQKLEQAIEQELKITTVDLSVPYIDPQFAEIRYQNPIFQQFKTWLGSNAPIVRTLEQLYNKKADKVNTAKQEITEKVKQEKDPLTSYIEKTWNPSSTRRR